MRRTRPGSAVCSLAPGHGHNLLLIVRWLVVSTRTGMVLNLSMSKQPIRVMVDRAPSTPLPQRLLARI